jgi:NMD protein affecting ribosome stability and mRNA decay
MLTVVICPVCGAPTTALYVEKLGMCHACKFGTHGEFSVEDMDKVGMV